MNTTPAIKDSRAVFEIYGTLLPKVPEGFDVVGLGMPGLGDFYIAKYDVYQTNGVPGECKYPWNPEQGPRLILKQKFVPNKYADPAGHIPFSVRHGYRPPDPELVRATYGTDITANRIPAGYVTNGFRIPEAGATFLPAFSVYNQPLAQVSSGFVTSPRIILKKKKEPEQNVQAQRERAYLGAVHVVKPMEKTIRVIRVLEYVGPESWVNNTLDHNAVRAGGMITNGGSYKTPGFDPRIRELSIHKEEVK